MNRQRGYIDDGFPALLALAAIAFLVFSVWKASQHDPPAPVDPAIAENDAALAALRTTITAGRTVEDCDGIQPPDGTIEREKEWMRCVGIEIIGHCDLPLADRARLGKPIDDGGFGMDFSHCGNGGADLVQQSGTVETTGEDR